MILARSGIRARSTIHQSATARPCTSGTLAPTFASKKS
jgi:hypothetical protein